MEHIAIILFVGAVIILALAGIEHYRIRQRELIWTDEIAGRAEILERRKADLDECQRELTERARILNMDTSTPVRATYFTSESDLLKYSDEKKLAKAVKKALCTQLADSMMKIAEPHKVRLDDGRDMYLLQYRVKEEL